MKIGDIIEELINEARFLEVSDIHFHPLEKDVEIFYRQYGQFIYQKKIKMEEYNKILRYVKFKSRLDISITKKPQDGSFTTLFKKEVLFVRISTIPLLVSESLVIRLLVKQVNQTTKELSYYKSDIYKIKNTIKHEIGLFIFTGPTGSGKTTTMYHILNLLQEEEFKKIITIENPIEIINEKFIQTQVNEDNDLDYIQILKGVLRQDPDIIMIGEIRDEKTARSVFRAALTGHTVISTLHTKNIYGVIKRFLDFGFTTSEIESVIIGISNQRLVLDENENVKAVFDYVLEEDINKLIHNKGLRKGIDEKLKEVQREVKDKKESKY